MFTAPRDGEGLAVRFRRSTYCGAGSCVEVATLPGDDIALRDTKDDRPDAPILRFTPDEWDAFVAGVLDGQFTRDALRGEATAG